MRQGISFLVTIHSNAFTKEQTYFLFFPRLIFFWQGAWPKAPKYATAARPYIYVGEPILSSWLLIGQQDDSIIYISKFQQFSIRYSIAGRPTRHQVWQAEFRISTRRGIHFRLNSRNSQTPILSKLTSNSFTFSSSFSEFQRTDYNYYDN